MPMNTPNKPKSPKSKNKIIIGALLLLGLALYVNGCPSNKKIHPDLVEPQDKVTIEKPAPEIGEAFKEVQPVYETETKIIPYSLFLTLLDKEKKDIEYIVVGKEKLIIKLKRAKEPITTFLTKNDPDLIAKLKESGIKFSFQQEKEGFGLFFWLFLVVLAFYVFNQRRSAQNPLDQNRMAKSGAKKINEDKKIETTFKDIAGIEEAKQEVQEIVEFLKNPDKFTRLGAKLPKGALLIGSPGCGKTLLAKAIAGEANVPFHSLSGSQFVEMFVGVGAARVRDLFEAARKQTPSIIFIDEVDSVGKSRGTGISDSEREQTLNQLLVEMDGIESDKPVVVLAATNRPDMLDAGFRKGRFDRTVLVPMPDVVGRKGILKIHTRDIVLAKNVNLKTLAKGTTGFSGADLANLANEAALIATRKKKNAVEMKDFEEAKDKVMIGYERKTLKLTDKDKLITATHETGHALVNAVLFQENPERADPLHKVSIVPRSNALGITVQLPTEDRYTVSEGFLLNKLVILLAGRVAEEFKLKEKSTGAKDDLKKATELVRQMICELGMSEKIGLAVVEEVSEHPFLGKRLGQESSVLHSEQTAKDIDEEIKKTLNKSYEKAKKIIENNITAFDKIVSLLLSKENLTGKEVVKIIKRMKK